MDTADSQPLSRISRMLLAGIGVAFAWVLLSILLNLSVSQAHAADGLLNDTVDTVAPVTEPVTEAAAPVTEPVAEAAAPVTAPVAEAAAPVTEPVAPAAPAAQPIVETVAPVAKTAAPVTEPVSNTIAPVTGTIAPVTQTLGRTAAPVTKTVAPVVETVGQTVASGVDTVGGIPQGGVVAPILDPTLGLVETVPVVGGVVTDVGLDSAASGAGSGVDGVLQGGTAVVIGTVSGAVDKPGRLVTAPAVSSLTDVNPVGAAPHSAPAATTGGALLKAAGNPWETLARAAFLTGATAWHSLTSDLSAALTSPDSAFVSSWAATGIFALLRSVVQADSSLVGPGGAGPGAWVLVALGLVVAYRAWVRRTGLENDVAPAAPVLSTDVSPD